MAIDTSFLDAATDNIKQARAAILESVEFCNELITSDGSALPGHIAAGTGAVATTIQELFRRRIDVMDYMTTAQRADVRAGTGSLDVSAAIIAAFNYARTISGPTRVDFDFGNYLCAYGFLVPSQCHVYLNGSTFTATTTFGQGVIPTNGTSNRGFFAINGSLTGGATLSGDTHDITIHGDGAYIDLRYDEQTGSPVGGIGISIETTPSPIEANEFMVRNIVVRDVTIEQSTYYGVYIAGPKDVLLDNVRVTNPANLGFVGISGRNVKFVNCYASGAQERIANQGCGYWNETNNAWQQIDNFEYINCIAEYNKEGGFKWWNDGADSVVAIYAKGCISRNNNWDGAAQVASTVEHGHVINKSAVHTAKFTIVLDQCVAENEYNAGFYYHRKVGGTAIEKVILNNCTAIRCNIANVDSYSRAPFSMFGDGVSDAICVVNNPTIIAPSANTLGYGLALRYGQGCHVSDPVYVGTFTYKGIVGTVPTARGASTTPTLSFDYAADNGTGIIGTATPFAKPVRLASWDQTAEPVASTEMFTNELGVWQDDNNQFHGIWKRDDSSTPVYLDFMPKKRLRGTGAYAGATINMGDQASATIAVTGAALGDNVQASYDKTLNSCFIHAYVSAADTVTWIISNNSVANRAVAAGNVIVNVTGSGY